MSLVHLLVAVTLSLTFQSAILVAGRNVKANPLCGNNTVSILQKFNLPSHPNTVVGDDGYIYITFSYTNYLYRYKRDTNGLLIGKDYTTSVNSSVAMLPIQLSILEFYSTSIGNTRAYVGSGIEQKYPMVTGVDLNKFQVTKNFSIDALPENMATDIYGFTFILSSDNVRNVSIYNFNDSAQDAFVTSFHVATSGMNEDCAFFISADDKMYVNSGHVIYIYNITRDSSNTPTAINVLNTQTVNVNENDCVSSIGGDKNGNLVGLDKDLIFTIASSGLQTTYCVPGQTTFSRMWSDKNVGYVFAIDGYANTLHVVSYQ